MAKQIPLTCSGHTRPVVDLSFSDLTPDGYFLISACKDGKPMIRQGDTGDWIGTFEGHKGAVWSATLNNGATQAATGAADFTAKIWDAVNGDELTSLPHKHIVRTVDFSPSGDKLLTGSNEKLVRIFDLKAPGSEPQLLRGHKSNIRKALWNQDTQCVFTGGDDKAIWFWDVRSLEVVKKKELSSGVTSMEITRDGSILVATYGNTVSFWDTQSLEFLKSYETPTPVYSASLHSSKKCFVACGEDFKLYKFDYNTGNILESYKGHFGPVHCVRYSPDGELYASGSEDGTLRLWQHTVGMTYGLWRAVTPAANNSTIKEESSNENCKIEKVKMDKV